MFNVMGFGVRGTGFPNTPISLASGQVYNIPSGQYSCHLGPYTAVQQYDGVQQTWRFVEASTQSAPTLVSSDGYNVRLINMTGTAVGAVITNAGTGYTNGIYPAGTQQGTAASPSVTFAAGGGSVLATGNIIVGGAINSTVAITNGGSNYTKAPILLISAPPAGGVQATATCTISAGVINAVTVTNQGAGYTVAPTINVVNAYNDTTGTGGVLTVNATLAGSGTVTAITMNNNGAGMTSVPSITFSPASTTAATAVMCFTALTLTGASGATNTVGTYGLLGLSQVTGGTATLTNPAISTGVFTPRIAVAVATTAAATYSSVILDGGLHQVTTITQGLLTQGGPAFGGTAYTPASTVGGTTDTVYLQTI